MQSTLSSRLSKARVGEILEIFALVHDERFDNSFYPLRTTRMYRDAVQKALSDPTTTVNEYKVMMFAWR